MIDDVIQQLGLSENTTIGMALVIMIIFIVIALRVMWVESMKTQREKNKQNHVENMERLRLDSEREKEAQRIESQREIEERQIQRDLITQLKRIREKLDEQDEQASSRRQVYQTLATTVGQLAINVDAQNTLMRETQTMMRDVTTDRLAWQTTTSEDIGEALVRIQHIEDSIKDLAKKIMVDDLPLSVRGSVLRLTELATTIEREVKHLRAFRGPDDQLPTTETHTMEKSTDGN